MITVQNICKTFHQAGKKIPVLQNINFTLNEAKTMAVAGPSGCGKTTLLSILAGLDFPDSGDVLIDGKSIVTMNDSELLQFRAKNIGIVFQQFHLMPHLTALENVSLPLEILKTPKASAKAKEQLESVGLSHRFDHFPSQMSGGECQRTAIARAVITRPKLLLADEPSGNLDQSSAQPAMDLLFSLSSLYKTTLILVTHNTALAKRCGVQFNLSQGSLIERKNT